MSCYCLQKSVLIIVILQPFSWGLIFDRGVLLPNDPNVIAGESLNATCQLNLSHPTLENIYDAFNIDFALGDHKIDRSFVTVHSKDRASLFLPHVSIENNQKILKCHVTSDLYIGAQQVLVGYRPFNMTIGDVYVENWQILNFTVLKPVNQYYVTTDHLWWKLWNETDDSYRLCKTCIESLNQPDEISCIVEDFGEKYITSEEQTLRVSIKANASNVVGTTETTSEYLVKNQVKPGKVLDLKVMPFVNDSLRLLVTWIPPKAGYSFNCEVEYFDEWTGHPEIQESSGHSVELVNLIPFTLYTVSVRCSSAHGGFSNDAVTQSNRTTPSVPAVQPYVRQGSFLSEQFPDTERTVTIFWQSPDQRDLQGSLCRYIVVFMGHQKASNFEVPGIYTNLTIPRLKPDSEYNFFVEVENNVGQNNSAQLSIATIPKQSVVDNEKVEPIPIVFAENDTLAHVWFDVEETPEKEVVCYWSIKGFKSEMQSRTLTPGVNVIDGLSAGVTNYQFGYGTKNSGILWSHVYDQHKSAEPPVIRKGAIHEESVEISLNEKYFPMAGYAVKYGITWCPSTGEKCPEGAPDKIVPRGKANHVVIQGLEPETEYRIEATSYTQNQQEPFGYNIISVHTKPPNAGLADWHIALMVTALCIVVIGICSFVYCCRSKIKKFFGAKIGIPDLPAVHEIKKDRTHPAGANDPLLNQPEELPKGTTQYSVLSETPQEERRDTYGQSTGEENKSETSSEYTEGTFGFEDMENHISNSAGDPYETAHIIDKTQPINLKVRPPLTYTKDNTVNKDTKFKFGPKNHDAQLEFKPKVDCTVGTLVADSSNDPVPEVVAKIALNQAQDGRSKKLKTKKQRNSENSNSFTNPRLSNKPPNFDGAISLKVYGRGESTDSSSSSGAYAPAQLRIGTFINENNTSSGSDATDYAAVQLLRGNTGVGKNNDSPGPSLQSDSGIGNNGSLSSARLDDDGLEWDSSDDNDDKPYKNRAKEVKPISDHDAPDFIDPEQVEKEEDKRMERDDGDVLGLGLEVVKETSDSHDINDGCNEHVALGLGLEVVKETNDSHDINDGCNVHVAVDDAISASEDIHPQDSPTTTFEPVPSVLQQAKSIPSQENGEDDGLGWDSSDDENVGYTRNKNKDVKMVDDPDVEDFPDPEKDNEMNI